MDKRIQRIARVAMAAWALAAMAPASSAAAPMGQSQNQDRPAIFLPLALRSGGAGSPITPAPPGSPSPSTTPVPTVAPTAWPLPTPVDIAPEAGWPHELVAQAGGTSYAIEVVGDVAYMGVGPQLLVVDASQLASMEPIANFRLRGLVEQIALHEDRLYVATGSGGLFIFDAGDPRSPRFLSHLPAISSSLEIAFAGDLAYLAEGVDGVRVLDLSDPMRPIEVHRLDTEGVSLAVEVAGDHLYLADGWGGLRIYDLSDPRLPRQVSTFIDLFEVLDVAIYDETAYVLEEYYTLHTLDVRDATRPSSLGATFELWGCCGWDMQVSDGFLYLQWVGDLIVLDLTAPRSPQQVQNLVLSPYDFAEALAVVGTRVFLGGAFGLRVIDPLSDAPTEDLGRLNITYASNNAVVTGKTLISGNVRYDLGDPAKPQRMADVPALPGQILAAAGD
jgi:hypothetical protein